MKSADAMANAMKNATRAMVTMNKRMNLPQLTAIMRSFGIETERLEATQDIMGESIDDALGGAEDEEEEDAVVKQVRTELAVFVRCARCPRSVRAHPRAPPPRPARVPHRSLRS